MPIFHDPKSALLKSGVGEEKISAGKGQAEIETPDAAALQAAVNAGESSIGFYFLSKRRFVLELGLCRRLETLDQSHP